MRAGGRGERIGPRLGDGGAPCPPLNSSGSENENGLGPPPPRLIPPWTRGKRRAATARGARHRSSKRVAMCAVCVCVQKGGNKQGKKIKGVKRVCVGGV